MRLEQACIAKVKHASEYTTERIRKEALECKETEPERSGNGGEGRQKNACRDKASWRRFFWFGVRGVVLCLARVS